MKIIDNLIKRFIGNSILITSFFQKHRWLNFLINFILFISMVLFLYFYISKDFDIITDFKFNINIKYLGVSILLLGLNYWTFVIAWHLLLKQFGVNTSFTTNFSFYSHSQIAKLLPTPAWFITGRLILYNNIGASKRMIFSLTVIETILHAYIGFILFLLLHIQPSSPITWLYSLSIIPLIWVMFYLNISNPNFMPISTRNISSKIKFIILLLFIFTWIISLPFIFYLVRSILPTEVFSLVILWRIWIISSLASYLAMFTLGGIGLLREFSLTLLLSPYVTLPGAMLIAALTRITITIGNLIWPLIFILLEKALKYRSLLLNKKSF